MPHEPPKRCETLSLLNHLQQVYVSYFVELSFFFILKSRINDKILREKGRLLTKTSKGNPVGIVAGDFFWQMEETTLQRRN